jgi:hypothetical protein
MTTTLCGQNKIFKMSMEFILDGAVLQEYIEWDTAASLTNHFNAQSR